MYIGFEELDAILKGLRPGSFNLIGARPAMGKTALALNIAMHAAMKEKKKVAYFSMELLKEHIENRVFLMYENIDITEFGENFIVDDRDLLTITQLENKSRELRLTVGVDLIIIDYLQLVQMNCSPSKRYKSTLEKDTEISRRIKKLAEELQIPIIVLTQVSRNIEWRENHRPNIDDLPEDARTVSDAILFIYREAYYDSDSEVKDIAEIIIAKNKYGEANRTILLEWDYIHRSFNNMSKEYKEIEKISMNKAVEMYGNPLPELVATRLKTELNFIRRNNYAADYLTTYKIVKHIVDNGHYVGSRGLAGSVLTSFLLEITDINPLPPHFFCSHCHYFEESSMAEDGFDLPEKECPVCKNKLQSDGHHIPYEGFMGKDGSKEPSFQINVSDRVQSFAETYAQTVLNVQDENLTHKILVCSSITFLEILQEKTGVKLKDINIKDPEILIQFQDFDTIGLPEHDQEFVWDTFGRTMPRTFSELVKFHGLIHGTNTWKENGEYLIEEGMPISKLPMTRDDIMNDLLRVGVEREVAYNFSEKVRKGLLARGKSSIEELLPNIELANLLGEWYPEYCNKIIYMFPKAHAVSYVYNDMRYMWFKKYYPKEFFETYLEFYFGGKEPEDELEKSQYHFILKECETRGIDIG